MCILQLRCRLLTPTEDLLRDNLVANKLLICIVLGLCIYLLFKNGGITIIELIVHVGIHLFIYKI